MKVHDKRMEESGRDPETGNYKEANALSLSTQTAVCNRDDAFRQLAVLIGERPGSRVLNI